MMRKVFDKAAAVFAQITFNGMCVGQHSYANNAAKVAGECWRLIDSGSRHVDLKRFEDFGGIVFAPQPIPPTPRQNHLLAAISAREFDTLHPELELVSMPLGQVLFESGAKISYAYFPTTCIVSLLYVTENGASAEIAVVGNEGVVGVSLLMGGETTTSRAVVQSAGHAYRLRGPMFKDTFQRAGGRRSGAMQKLLLRFIQSILTQMAQTAVCNRHHSIDQQLCRWLLMSIDRLPGNELHMTQELIANMLGVRREGVTEAAGKLQQAGLIHYSRGKITVLNRPGLEARVCECYAVVRKETDRLLPECAFSDPVAEL